MKKKSMVILVVLVIICIGAFLLLQKKTLVVAADNIYEKVFTESALDEFHKRNPSIKLQILYGTSVDMKQKIENGEKIDLFLSGVAAEMDSLKTKGLVDADSIAPLWIDNIVLIGPPDKQSIKVNDMMNIARIAICHPDRVRSGTNAREALKEAGIWEDVRKNMVFATSEPEVLIFVTNSSTDAGIVYASTAASAGDKVSVAGIIPGGDYKGAVLSAGIVHNSKGSKQAQTIIDYLKSDVVKQAMSDSGFTPAE